MIDPGLHYGATGPAQSSPTGGVLQELQEHPQGTPKPGQGPVIGAIQFARRIHAHGDDFKPNIVLRYGREGTCI